MIQVPTYTATIAVGLREYYSDIVNDLSMAKAICQRYVSEKSLCVTVTPTTFLYANGHEPGCLVGLINYPRFPRAPQDIEEHAIALATQLKSALNQHRVSIIFPDKTVMLGDPE